MGTKRHKKHKVLQRIELKCLEMKEMMYQRSEYVRYSAEEIENRVLAFRNMLIEKEGIENITENLSEKKDDKEAKDEKSTEVLSPLRGSSCSSNHSTNKNNHRKRKRSKSSERHHYESSSDSSRSFSRSPSIRRRKSSPSHLDKRRITSARKRPIPYHRPSPVRYSASSDDDFSIEKTDV